MKPVAPSTITRIVVLAPRACRPGGYWQSLSLQRFRLIVFAK
jgi:hypothetical protein